MLMPAQLGDNLSTIPRAWTAGPEPQLGATLQAGGARGQAEARRDFYRKADQHDLLVICDWTGRQQCSVF